MATRPLVFLPNTIVIFDEREVALPEVDVTSDSELAEEGND